MPEANILYTVTGVVVAGLVVWMLAALKMAKEPWARPEAAAAAAAASSKKRVASADVPVEKTEEKPAETAAEEATEEKASEEKASEEKKEEA